MPKARWERSVGVLDELAEIVKDCVWPASPCFDGGHRT